jgi:hypothetical protein
VNKKQFSLVLVFMVSLKKNEDTFAHLKQLKEHIQTSFMAFYFNSTKQSVIAAKSFV